MQQPTGPAICSLPVLPLLPPTLLWKLCWERGGVPNLHSRKPKSHGHAACPGPKTRFARSLQQTGNNNLYTKSQRTCSCWICAWSALILSNNLLLLFKKLIWTLQEYWKIQVFFCLCSGLQLRSSNDGFSVVADYFGRGVFNKLTLVTDPPGSKSVGNLEVNLQRDLLIHTKRNS